MLRRIAVVFGTRPEAIKMAPVILALRESANFKVRVVASGQHMDLVVPILEVFGLSVDIALSPDRAGGSLASLHGSMLQQLHEWMSKEDVQGVLVHGDTATTLAAAQASFYLGIPVGHVEAGLRTHDKALPFPEEMNRRLTSALATWHFAPTPLNKQNLLAEGVPDGTITVTGNTVVDSLNWLATEIENPTSIAAVAAAEFANQLPFDPLNSDFAVITAHRRENIGRGLTELVHALSELSRMFPNFWFVFPLHPNPEVRTPVEHALRDHRNILMTEPLGYPEFVMLLANCKFVVSDSGGIQEEAPSFGKHVLVLRHSTERPEGIEAGTSELVRPRQREIVSTVALRIEASRATRDDGAQFNPYGDGTASQRIVSFLEAADF